MLYSIGDIARIAGVTVRTLHHYDAIALVSPTARSASGYRLYSDDDVDRLQQVLFYRELTFSLDQIAVILDDPTASPAQHLSHQRHLLVGQIGRLEALVATIDRTLEARRMGYDLTLAERLEIFGQWEPPPSYFEELKAFRANDDGPFGSTDGWPVPQTKADWEAIEMHRRGVAERMREAMEAGVAADSVTAMDIAEAERGVKTHVQQVLIADWFASKPEYFGSIARPNEQLPGMAAWFRDAVHANASRAAT